jgi:hypothetical protein
MAGIRVELEWKLGSYMCAVTRRKPPLARKTCSSPQHINHMVFACYVNWKLIIRYCVVARKNKLVFTLPTA